jgi:hypothetical protein
VFFVIKIEKIRTRRGHEGDARIAIHLAPSPHLLEGTPSQFVEGNSHSGEPLGSSRTLTRNAGVYARPDCPMVTSFSAKIPSFLHGSGSKVENDGTYRKQRKAYQSIRDHNSLLATIELTHIFASNKVKNRAPSESSPRQNQPMQSSVPRTILVPEGRHV